MIPRILATKFGESTSEYPKVFIRHLSKFFLAVHLDHVSLGHRELLPYHHGWIGGCEVHRPHVFECLSSVPEVGVRESSSEEKPCQLIFIWCHLQPCHKSMVVLILELVFLLIRAVMEASLLPVVTDIASRCIRYTGDVSVTLNLLLDISHHDKPVMVDIPPFLLGKRGS